MPSDSTQVAALKEPLQFPSPEDLTKDLSTVLESLQAPETSPVDLSLLRREQNTILSRLNGIEEMMRKILEISIFTMHLAREIKEVAMIQTQAQTQNPTETIYIPDLSIKPASLSLTELDEQIEKVRKYYGHLRTIKSVVNKGSR